MRLLVGIIHLLVACNVRAETSLLELCRSHEQSKDFSWIDRSTLILSSEDIDKYAGFGQLYPDIVCILSDGYVYKEGSIIAGQEKGFAKILFRSEKVVGYSFDFYQVPEVEMNRIRREFSDLVSEKGNVCLKYIDSYSACNLGAKILNGVSPEVQGFMTPFSGIVYGRECGFDGIETENRRRYKQLKEAIVATDFEILVMAVNPSVRAIVIEQALLTKNATSTLKKRAIAVLDSLNEVYDVIETCSGCIYEGKGFREAVELFLPWDYREISGDR